MINEKRVNSSVCILYNISFVLKSLGMSAFHMFERLFQYSDNASNVNLQLVVQYIQTGMVLGIKWPHSFIQTKQAVH